MIRMKTFAATAAAGLLLASSPAPTFAQNAKAWATTPEIPYDVTIPYKMPPGLYMGEGIGVATNSKGHIFVHTRSGMSRTFEFDAAGNFVKEFGKDSYGYGFAHSVRVDKDDNVWTVDEGPNIVQKFAPDGRLLMVMGKRPDAIEQLSMMPGTAPYSGANRPYSFHRPTDIGWDKDGNIFVSDGYTDARIVKYDKNGRFIKSAGKRGDPKIPLNFAAPHTMQVDDQGNVYYGDRSNQRIVVLDNNLNQLRVYDQTGAPWGLCVTPGPHQYLYTSNSTGTTIDSRNQNVVGEIYKMELDGTVLGKFGHAGVDLKEFASIHMMDCRQPNTVYVSEIQGWRIKKVTLRP